MAITIDDQPYEYTPIGQRLMIVATSDNVSNAGFRYVFDFGSFQVNVQPNASNKGILDLAPIFRESLITTFIFGESLQPSRPTLSCAKLALALP